MHGRDDTWALVLAAGEGRRLRHLTTTASGLAVPKQFCSLRGGASLLHQALQRAGSLAPPEHICTVVAAQHRRWWHRTTLPMPAANVIVQPENRGTANGVLLPLLHIARRNRHAGVVILPSDHHVRAEERLCASLRAAIAELRSLAEGIVMLGIEPDEADSELGYIVPRPGDGDASLEVKRFVEKPDPIHARELIEEGGLWNSFIIASSVKALLGLYEQRCPVVVSEMRRALLRDELSGGRSRAIARLYERLPVRDFSRDILQGQEARLRVLRVRQCGWSDLGTPKRVADTLRRLPDAPVARDVGNGGDGYLDLAVQHARQCVPAPPSVQ
jgi:mannose-1-phosphate guanylyltransferase